MYTSGCVEDQELLFFYNGICVLEREIVTSVYRVNETITSLALVASSLAGIKTP